MKKTDSGSLKEVKRLRWRFWIIVGLILVVSFIGMTMVIFEETCGGLPFHNYKA